jgi:hypothetical protein
MTSAVVADLRHLNYILFSGKLDGCIGIMRRLFFPRNSATVSLRFSPESALYEKYHSLVVPFILDYFSPSEPHKIDDSLSIYSISIVGNHGLTIECLPHFNSSSLTSFSKPTSSLEIPVLIHSYPSHVQGMQTVLAKLPVANLRRLSICHVKISPDEWRSVVFTCMNGLEELELEYNETQTAVVALIPGPIDDQRSEDCDSGIDSDSHYTAVPDIPLPNLKRLFIALANLQKPFFRGISLSVALLRCVEARSHAGHPLDSMTFRGYCSLALEPPDVETTLKLRKWTKVDVKD